MIEANTSELLIMRHAKSAWDTGASDFWRPLNGRGRRAADRMAEWLVANGLEPDRVVSSAALRARSTAEAVILECGVSVGETEFDEGLYLASASSWMHKIAMQTCTRLLICGHNPGLDDLVDHLSAKPPRLTTSGKLMTTAAIAYLRFDSPIAEVTAGAGELVTLVRPRELGDGY